MMRRSLTFQICLFLLALASIYGLWRVYQWFEQRPDHLDEFDYHVSWSPSISADGRYVAFDSTVPNLVAGDENSSGDVFVFDRATRKIERVSISSERTEANRASSGASISADGRYVAFTSDAYTLVHVALEGREQVFIHDRESGETHVVSVSSDTKPGNHHSFYPALSADGRCVVFQSRASNLIPNDTNDWPDIFVRDRLKEATERVSVSSRDDEANGGSWEPSISPDGRHVVFASDASNLVPNDTNKHTDVFLHDRWTHKTQCISLNTMGEVGDDNSGRWGRPTISSDGRYVAFMSAASDLVAGDTNGRADVFVRDRLRRTTRRVSLSWAGQQGNAGSGGAVISSDGRFVAFVSEASNLVHGDTNECADVFVRGLETQETERISILAAGLGDGGSGSPSISADGRCVAFEAEASRSVTRETKLRCSIYVRDRKTGKTECVSLPRP